MPYDRGDLVSRIHDAGEVLEETHNGEGTLIRAQVSAALAAELTPYSVVPATAE